MHWPGYPSKHLYVKRTGHKTRDKTAIYHYWSDTWPQEQFQRFNKQITKAVVNIGRCYNMSTLTWPHPLSSMVISTTVKSCTEEGLAMQD